MHFFSISSSKLAPEEAEGVSAAIDPGVPFEHGEPAPPRPVAPKPEKSDVEKRLEALEADLTSARRERDEARESERYWANRARGQRQEPDEEEPEPEPEPEPITRRAAADERPETLLDDMSAAGLEALRKRGVITEDELERRLAAERDRSERRIQAAESNAEWATKFAQEFPEIAEDNMRMTRGEQPKNELFKRAGQIYREMLADDPRLKNSQGALTAAARAAKRELAAEAKVTEADKRTSREDRRERIESQRGERDRGGAFDDGGDAPISKLGSQVIGHLARFGVTEDSYRDHQGEKNSNGMPHVGGRKR